MKIDELVPEDGDGFIVIRHNGMGAVGYVRHGDNLLTMPCDLETHYAEPGEKPRKFVVRAGWNEKQWAKACSGSSGDLEGEQ